MQGAALHGVKRRAPDDGDDGDDDGMLLLPAMPPPLAPAPYAWILPPVAPAYRPRDQLHQLQTHHDAPLGEPHLHPLHPLHQRQLSDAVSLQQIMMLQQHLQLQRLRAPSPPPPRPQPKLESAVPAVPAPASLVFDFSHLIPRSLGPAPPPAPRPVAPPAPAVVPTVAPAAPQPATVTVAPRRPPGFILPLPLSPPESPPLRQIHTPQRKARPTHYEKSPTLTSPARASTTARELVPLVRYVDCDVCGGSDEGESFLTCVVCHCRVHPQCLTLPPADTYTYTESWTCTLCAKKLARVAVTPAQLFSPERFTRSATVAAAVATSVASATAAASLAAATAGAAADTATETGAADSTSPHAGMELPDATVPRSHGPRGDGEIVALLTEHERSERGLVGTPAARATTGDRAVDASGIVKVLRVRHTVGDAVEFLVERVSAGAGSDRAFDWVPKAALAGRPDVVLAYFMSTDFDRMAMSRNVLPLLHAESVPFGKDMTEITYRFASNHAYFGIKQYTNVFDAEFLKFLEDRVDELVTMGSSGVLKPATMNYTPALKRSKFFFGFAYVDYQYGGKPELVDDVDDIPEWVRQLEARLVERGLLPAHFVEQAVVNMYHEQGSGLGVHMDSRDLFERPIISLRLFSDSVLSFGCKGLGMVLRKQAVPLYRGAITVMEHYAANKTKHCIRPADIHRKSASVLLRKIQPRAKHLLQRRKPVASPEMPADPVSSAALSGALVPDELDADALDGEMAE